MKKNNNYIVSSGNVFADLELPDSSELLAKAELARRINAIIKQKDITQAEAAKLLDIDQPKISALHKGRLSGFSLERLFRFLNILGQDITIRVLPKKKSKPIADIAVTLPIHRKVPAIKKPATTPVSMHARKKAKTRQ
ncbi:MAG TPA: helix-turn-helix transcriptional regulator [Candidatus Babeliales bacterium]|jgi:predicted XRE-type DNA-binding protein|nr:helix-turn-helix transcriptional regulator [Candidatus Babeliales bacterium]